MDRGRIFACSGTADPHTLRPVARHFLTGEEFEPDELRGLIERALELKAAPRSSNALLDVIVALVFEKPSTRTRLSFEAGVIELGGDVVVLRGDELQLSRGESVHDTGLVLSRQVDAVGVRTGPHDVIEQLAAACTIPVINMLTAEHHPCQVLADLLTLRETFGSLNGLKLAYVGDGNNVARSLAIVGSRAGVDIAIASPPGYQLEDDFDQRRAALAPYRLDDELLDRAAPGAIALHCLPAHPGEEITTEVLYGPRQRIWDQAENRRHAQKALLEALV
jgi:ornithine carbamoyltransferase